MLQAIVIGIIFVSLLRLRLLYKPFFIKPAKFRPTKDEDVNVGLIDAINIKTENSRGILIDTFYEKIRLYKTLKSLRNIVGVDCGISFILAELTETIQSLIDVPGVCSENIFGIRFPEVRGVPRIYSVCAAIAEGLIGEMSDARLCEFIGTIESSELNECEKQSFCYILSLCFAGVALGAADRATVGINEYLRGRSDGLMYKIDLMSINHGAYSAGLYSVLNGDEKDEYNYLAVCNDIDVGKTIRDFYLELTRLITDVVCACRSARRAVGLSIADGNYADKPFGGETEYKSNTLSNPSVALSTDNRGVVTVCALGKCIPVTMQCESDGESISLPSCDGVMCGGRTVYHAVRDNIELSIELTVPPELCVQSARFTVINRSNITRNVKISTDYSLNAVSKRFDGYTVYKLGDDCIAIFSSVNAVIESGKCICSSELCPFERKTFTVSVVFGSKYAVVGKGALAQSIGFFDRAVYSCGAYRKLCGEDFTVCDGDVLRGVEYFSNTVINTDKFEREKIEQGYYDNDYITPFDGGLTNVAADGNYKLLWHSDGRSESMYCGGSVSGNAVIALEEDGCVWSPSYFPCGKGVGYTSFSNGKTTYFSSYRGLSCALERAIVPGNNAELFTLFVTNNSDNERCVYAMLSQKTDGMECVCVARGIVAQKDGEYMTVAASGKVNDFTFFAEGYFKHGVIDRASGFRSGGVAQAPTVSVKLDIPPHCTQKTEFAIMYSREFPSENVIESMFTSHLNSNNRRLLIKPATSSATLNSVYTRAEYLAFSSVRGDADAQSELCEKLNIARDYYGRGKFDSAYRALMSAVADAEKTGVLYRDDEECFCAARLIYKTVTDNLFGISVRGDTARINPKLYNCPIDICYDVHSPFGITKVKIDSSETRGDWFIRQGIITRNQGVIKLCDGEITLKRNGYVNQKMFIGAENN